MNNKAVFYTFLVILSLWSNNMSALSKAMADQSTLRIRDFLSIKFAICSGVGCVTGVVCKNYLPAYPQIAKGFFGLSAGLSCAAIAIAFYPAYNDKTIKTA